MAVNCSNKVAVEVLGDVAKVLPYDFKSQKATIKVLEGSKNGSIFLFLQHQDYWHSYYIQKSGDLSQARGGSTPNDQGVPPIKLGYFQPDVVAQAWKVIQSKCSGNALTRK